MKPILYPIVKFIYIDEKKLAMYNFETKKSYYISNFEYEVLMLCNGINTITDISSKFISKNYKFIGDANEGITKIIYKYKGIGVIQGD